MASSKAARNLFLGAASLLVMGCGGKGDNPTPTPPVDPPVDPVVEYTSKDNGVINTSTAAYYLDPKDTQHNVQSIESTAPGVGVKSVSGGATPASIQISDSDIAKVENLGAGVDYTLKAGADPIVTYKDVKDETTKTIYKLVTVHPNKGATATGHIILYSSNKNDFDPSAKYDAAYLKSLNSANQTVKSLAFSK